VVEVKEEGRARAGSRRGTAAGAGGKGADDPVVGAPLLRVGRRKRMLSEEEGEEGEEGAGREVGSGVGRGRGGSGGGGGGSGGGEDAVVKDIVAVPASTILRSLTPDSAVWCVPLAACRTWW
jgi:hypothetical protein